MSAGRRPVAAKPRRPRRRSRWVVVLLVLVLAVLAVGGLLSVPGVPGHDQAALLSELAVSDAGGAVAEVPPFRQSSSDDGCAGLESQFGIGNHTLKNSRIGWYASIWPSYQLLQGLFVGSLLPVGAACRSDFEDDVSAIDATYWDDSPGRSAPAFDQGPNAFHVRSDPPRVDDSLWMGLAIMDDESTTGAPGLLARAEAVFRLAVANWDPRRGGVYWEDHTPGATNQYKSVVSNAPAVVLGAALYSRTGQSTYLTWSRKIFDWLEENLRDARTGLYDDSVEDDGARTVTHTEKLTYNQGIVLGAMAALSTVDPGSYPMGNVTDFAQTCLAYFAAHVSYGDPGFDSIWFDNLLWAAGLAGDPALARAAHASLETALAREPQGAEDLLDRGSEMTLRQLSRVPSRQDAGLFPAVAVRAASGRPSP